MKIDYQKTWDAYTTAWQAETLEEKEAIFKTCLDDNFEYTDPLINTKGWRDFLTYMLDFHQQVPGGHFVSSYYMAHSGHSITNWLMKNGDKQTVGEGISYGKYNENGKLVSATGFFELPDQ